MRPIKFRAWDGITKNMVPVKSLYFEQDGKAGCAVDIEDINGDLESEWSLMQYTGMKDKNNIEIYEDDVVIAKSVRSMVGMVIFSKGQWLIKNSVTRNTQLMDSGVFELIGNIYENPDLQKVVMIMDSDDKLN